LLRIILGYPDTCSGDKVASRKDAALDGKQFGEVNDENDNLRR
jgi:hypothetical protein